MFLKSNCFPSEPGSKDTVPKVDLRVAMQSSKPKKQEFMTQKIEESAGIAASVCKELRRIAGAIEQSGGILDGIPQKLHQLAYEITPKPIPVAFDNLDEDTLEFMRIECASEVEGIRLKEDSFRLLSSEASRRGEDGAPTPQFFGDYLTTFGINMIIGDTKGDIRQLIYSFYCRVYDMTIPSLSNFFTITTKRKLYLKVVIGSFELSGYVDYTIGIIPSSLEGDFYQDPIKVLREQKGCTSLLLAEAKSVDTVLSDCIPQLIGELYAFAHEFGKDVVRGVISSGARWMFVILKRTEGTRARYWFSKEFSIGSRTRIDIPCSHFVTGVLARWVEAAYKDLDQNDCFVFNGD